MNRLLIKTYLKQLLEDGFFHADPHPGNLLVMPDGRLAFFDFGMVGRITPELQAKMIDAFFHVVGKDPAGIAQDLIDLDFLKPGTNPSIVKPVVEKMFEFHLNLKLKDVNFKELTYDLADVMYDYPFRLPSNFTYIMRALMTLEGIGIITDPEFNFFETAKPYAKEFMLRREGKDFRKHVRRKADGPRRGWQDRLEPHVETREDGIQDGTQYGDVTAWFWIQRQFAAGRFYAPKVQGNIARANGPGTCGTKGRAATRRRKLFESETLVMKIPGIKIHHTASDFHIGDFNDSAWKSAAEVQIIERLERK